jgi:ABC-type Mn2+/Zn2+ transport system permease subunit
MPQTLQIFWCVLLLGPILGAMCALLSVFVVLRRMALISEGVSHAGYGGIAIAIGIGSLASSLQDGLLKSTLVGPVGQEIITGIFCMITALLIGYVTRRKRVSEDSAIGIFLVATVAFGQILLSILRAAGTRLPAEPERLLFGDFTSVGPTDLIIVATVALLVAVTLALLYYQFLYTTLDEEMARINGVNTRLINTLLLLMISLVIVVCVRMVGFLMITALMIIPGATANMLSRRFGGVLALSLLIGAAGTSAATFLMINPPFNRYSSGPIVVLILFTLFTAAWLFRTFIKPKALPPSDALTPPESHAHSPSAFGHTHAH